MKKYLIAACSLLSTGCVSTEHARKVWVDPASVSDQAKYAQDFDECRALGWQVFHEDQAARQAAVPGGMLVGALIGAALGGALAPRGMGGDIARFGAVEGAVAGGAAAARDSGADPARSMLTAMRECLRGRGYRTLR